MATVLKVCSQTIVSSTRVMSVSRDIAVFQCSIYMTTGWSSTTVRSNLPRTTGEKHRAAGKETDVCEVIPAAQLAGPLAHNKAVDSLRTIWLNPPFAINAPQMAFR